MADAMRYYLGLDLGSTAAKAALVDDGGRVVATRYQRHNGRALEAAARLLREMMARPEGAALAGIAVTGSAARPVSEKLALPFYNEAVALATALRELHPEFRSAIEVGGQDAKIIELAEAAEQGGPGFQDFSMNTECAAGTGSFLDQQASRLGVRIEDEFGAMALRSKKPPRVAGRCSVFAKSDMIHLQQQAVPDYDIVAGLCFGMARNFKANLARGRELQRPVALVGGVAGNAGMVRAFREVFGFADGELRVPEYHDVLPAIGAALILRRERTDNRHGPSSPDHATPTFHFSEAALEELVGYREAPAARLKPLRSPEGYLPSVLATPGGSGKIGVYLGVDVGSISTNLVLVDEAGGLLAKIYIQTSGRPIEAVRAGLGMLAPEWAGRAEVRGVGTTGSGRYLTGDIVGADVVRNEITAQARGAASEVPDVDTIFEIGGQDSKYIRLRNGVVVDFEMNHVCAAGTGSFLEEQAERLGISIKEEFARLALSSRAPVRLGERCTVFMESDLVHQQQQGAALEDLVAGLSYSIAANYLNRVVGTRGVGRRILFQGGTAFNRAVTAAFAELTGREITVPPHHEVTGAIGAALLVHEAHERGEYKETAFRGFELAERKYEVKSFTCNSCANYCDIREVRVEGQAPLYYGSRCDRYNKKKETAAEREHWPDLFAEREELLLGGKTTKTTTPSPYPLPSRERGEEAAATTEEETTASPSSAGGFKNKGTVGIPRALIFHQMLPFWRTLLERLGFEVVVSPATDAGIVQAGVESVVAQVCFPVKVAQGHVRWLVGRGVDYVLVPSVTSLPRDHESQQNNHLCPYVQSLPYQVEAALGLKAAGVKVLSPVVALEKGYAAALPSLKAWGRTLEISSGEMGEALAAATAAQDEFETACRERGREILDSPPAGARLAVLVSRPSNGCDAGLNMDVARRMRTVGLLAVPMDFLDLRGFDLGEDWSNLYWKYGQKIVRAAEIIRARPDLQAVYISNFGCGPDSFLRRFFQEALGDRPMLGLEIDEHSAPAGLVTRLEAFVDSLRGAQQQKQQQHPPAVLGASKETTTSRHRVFPATEPVNGRTLLVPQMCDHAFAFAAAFRGAGLAARVIPASDEESLALGRQWTSGRECLPCIVTAGDMLRELGRPGADPAKLAFFMPSGTGPCRFGMYNRLHQLILRDAGYAGVPIVSPNQGASFYRDFQRLPRDPTRAAWQGIVAIDALLAALLAVRPYETTTGAAEAAYRDSLRAVEATLERGGSLGETMEWCANRFAALAAARPEERRPRVGIVGEIYVRSHTFSNQDLVRRLEGLGLEVELAGFAEWIYYTNWTRKRRTRAERDWRLWLGTQVKERVQRRDEAAIKRPFRNILGDLREPATGEVVALGSPYIHDTFEGEAVLSVGKAVEMAHGGAAGVVNVMPFTCMPGNIVAAVLKRVRRDLRDLPMLSIAYDGQRDGSLEIRLEAFAEQVKAFDKGKSKK
jgi:predicted CoA-substrate-specific enzyme activase